MNRDEARQTIRSSWRQILPGITDKARDRVNGEDSFICPFCGHGTHGDGLTRNPKSKDGNGLKCFSCDFSGDIIALYQQYTGADYNTALRQLADDIGITIDPYRPTAAEDFSQERATGRAERPQTDGKPQGGINAPVDGKTPQEAAERPQADYTAYYEACRQRISDPAAAAYLQARGIRTDTAIKYGIGYDPQADPANAPGATGSEYKPHPAPRLIVPCTKDFYIARSIDKSTPSAFKSPNPKGSSTRLFNAAALYADSSTVFVVEGVFDALSFLEYGMQAVALNGKGNGRLLLEQLKKKPTGAKIIISHDNERKEDGTPDEKKQAQTMQQAQELCKSLQAIGAECIIYNVAGRHHDANEALINAPEEFSTGIMDAIAEAMRDYLTDFLEKIQTEAYKPYRTELSFFDGLLNGGVIRQTLLLLLAAPGTGKTTLCAQIAECMAIHKKPVVYFNLEMSREQMIAKAISSRLARKGTYLTTLDIMQGYRWTDEQRQEVIAAVGDYREKVEPFLMYNPDGIGSDLDAIRGYLHSIGEAAKAAGKEAPAVVVDYMHLITSRAGLDVQELIKQAVVMLKQYAIDYNTFVIGIVATNRESNKAGRISMESGRDSSNLEYTADYQLSLNYYEIDNGEVKITDMDGIARLQQQKWRHMIIRVLKGRFCMPGKTARIYFNAENNIFYGENDFIPADDELTPFDDLTTTNDTTQKRQKRL